MWQNLRDIAQNVTVKPVERESQGQGTCSSDSKDEELLERESEAPAGSETGQPVVQVRDALWENIRDTAYAEGAAYKGKYFADAQFIFSRAQHRFHKKTKKGYVPLPRACTSSRCKDRCKADFPKEKQVNSTIRVICAGTGVASVCA